MQDGLIPVKDLKWWQQIIHSASLYSWNFFRAAIPAAVFALGCLVFFPFLPFSFLTAVLVAGAIGFLTYGAWNLAYGIAVNKNIKQPEQKPALIRVNTADDTNEEAGGLEYIPVDQMDHLNPEKNKKVNETNIRLKGVGVYFRYMAALIALVTLFSFLIILSPVAVAFSMPMVGLVSLFSAFTFLDMFYRAQLLRNKYTSTASMISKRLLINGIMLGLLVAVFFPILSPFVFVACVLGALALSRILCEPFVLAYDNRFERKKINESILDRMHENLSKKKSFFEHLKLAFFGVGHMLSKILRSVVPFFIPIVGLAFFLSPIVFGITLGWPVILVGSAFAALTFGRVFFHTSKLSYQESIENLLKWGVASGIFSAIILGAVMLFASITLPLVPLALVIFAGTSLVLMCIYSFFESKNTKDEELTLQMIHEEGYANYVNVDASVDSDYCLFHNLKSHIVYDVKKVCAAILPFPVVGCVAAKIWCLVNCKGAQSIVDANDDIEVTFPMHTPM